MYVWKGWYITSFIVLFSCLIDVRLAHYQDEERDILTNSLHFIKPKSSWHLGCN